MWANRILLPLINIAALITLPLVWVSTFVLGIAASLTFGLILLPFSLIWVVAFLGPLLGLSWLWDQASLLRIPLALVGIPLALVASVFVAPLPSMGDTQSRHQKLNLCWAWPFSLDLMKLQTGKYLPPEGEQRAWDILDRIEVRLGIAMPTRDGDERDLEAELIQAQADLDTAKRDLSEYVGSLRSDASDSNPPTHL